MIVAPVGCDDRGEKEENGEPDAAVENVLWELSVPNSLMPNLLSSAFFSNTKDEATFEIDDSPRAPKKPVCCG